MIFATLFKRGAVAYQLGSTVLSQALLSAANFFVAFILLRRLGDDQYGYYVLASVTLLLVASLQGAYFQPPIVVELARRGLAERKAFMGGLVGGRSRLVWGLALVVIVAQLVAWISNLISSQIEALLLAGSVSGIAVLFREFFRGVLLAYHRTQDVLRGDIAYVVLLLGSVFIVTLFPQATVLAIASVGLSALCSALILSRAAWRFEPWDLKGSLSAIRDIRAQGVWSVFGAAVHWTFSQGYTYIVAAMLDVRAVAALAATRLLLMPINVISSGANQSTFPLLSRWHEQIGFVATFRRTVRISTALVALFGVYVGLVWIFRGWLFNVLIHKSADHQDILIIIWSAIFLVMTIRDQFVSLLSVRARLEAVSKFTFASAVLAVFSIWFAIPMYGPAGALVGILVGELFNVAGLLLLSTLEIRRARAEVIA